MSDCDRSPGKVGLVGAGPWAEYRHAPMLAAGPDFTLSGIWARRPQAAGDLASKYGVPAFDDVDALFEASDAIAFAVPPDVQVDLAIRAAEAGKALLLEKPIAMDLDGARRVASAVVAAGVPTQMMLTWRYSTSGRSVLSRAREETVIGARGSFILGSLLGGPFATPWRVDRGGFLDLAPHLFDYLDAALGRITRVTAHGTLRGWTGLLVDHEGGAVSDVSISAIVPVEPMVAGVEIYTNVGRLTFDANDSNLAENYAAIMSEFAGTARGASHPLDVHRGVYLQELIDSVEQELSR